MHIGRSWQSWDPDALRHAPGRAMTSVHGDGHGHKGNEQRGQSGHFSSAHHALLVKLSRRYYAWTCPCAIQVRLREYGSELVEVCDNGSGISPEDYQVGMRVLQWRGVVRYGCRGWVVLTFDMGCMKHDREGTCGRARVVACAPIWCDSGSFEDRQVDKGLGWAEKYTSGEERASGPLYHHQG